MKSCPNCGKKLYDLAQRCDGCGARGLGNNGNETHYTKVANKIHEIEQLEGSGTPIRQIARQTGLARNTVKTVLQGNSKSITPRIKERIDKLVGDSFNRFKEQYDRDLKQYPNNQEDCFWELAVDCINFDSLISLMADWVNRLDRLHNNAFNQGAKYSLNAFKIYLQKIKDSTPVEQAK